MAYAVDQGKAGPGTVSLCLPRSSLSPVSGCVPIFQRDVCMIAHLLPGAEDQAAGREVAAAARPYAPQKPPRSKVGPAADGETPA